MRKSAIALFACLIAVPGMFPQDQQISVEQRNTARQSAGPEKKDGPTLTKQQQEQAMQMLEAAEAGARGMDPGSRAYALMQVARAYQDADKKKAVELLEEAMTSARMVGQEDEDLKSIGSRLQQQVLKAMVPLAPEKADEMLPQLDPKGREQVLSALLDYYEHEKRMDRALDVIYRIGQESEIPYGAASRVMEKMTPEQTADKQQLFTVALGSYRDHDHAGGMSFGEGDFANMIVEFQKDLPPSLIHQAIDVVLDSARKAAEKEAKDGQPTTISVASAQGAVQLNSTYMFRLFQLLPVLKSIDPDEADQLLKQQNDVQTLLAKYPQGMSSVSGDPKSKNSNSTSFMVSSGGPGPGGPGGSGRRGPGAPGGGGFQGPNVLEMQRAAKIAQDAETHPQDALANASGLQNPGIRANAYLGIARSNWKKNSSVAHQALQKAAETVPQVEGDQQVMMFREIAQLYLRMGETDDAKKYISKGMDAAEKLLKADTNADDPNRAPKAYWPSSAGYRSMLSLAAQISPSWAATMLKEVPDDDLRALGQLGIATEMLQTGSKTTEVMSFNKEGERMMVMSNEGRPD
jgi:tetratricopeptide (TPR) repeat protein